MVRLTEDRLVIAAIAAGIGDMDDELFKMNDTSKTIGSKLDGGKSLSNLAAELATESSAPLGEIGRDVLGLMTKLPRRRMVVVQ